MTSIAPVSLNNIGTQWRCALKQYSVGRSIVGKGIRHMTVGGCADVKRCVFNFFRKIVTDFASRI